METRVVLVTVPDEAKALEISKMLVSEGLAACVSVIPGLQSIYRWKGELQHDREFLMVIKSSVKKLNALEEAIHKVHPYQTPEFLAIKTDYVSQKYSKWLGVVLSEK